MNTNPDLDKKYDRFIGQKLGIVTVGMSPYTYQTVDDTDALYLELAAEAVGDGFRIRAWLPNTMGTMDYDLSRINLRLSADGVITQLDLG